VTHDDEANLEQTDHEPVEDSAADGLDDAASVEHHDATTHMDAHTTLSDDDHGHAEEHLGPIDWGAWGAALIGAAGALVVVAVFWVTVF
jgi:hypothetical protein